MAAKTAGAGQLLGYLPGEKQAQAEAAAGPTSATISTRDLGWQFWRDVFGKEVQDATTYSYTWLADQTGHICLGLVLTVVLFAGVKIWLLWPDGEASGMLGSTLITMAWEAAACWVSLYKSKGGPFPVGRALLLRNAFTAWYYMFLGALLGWVAISAAQAGMTDGTPRVQMVEMLVLILAAVAAAPEWMRQKIIWQRAALPYLFRLAQTDRDTFGGRDASDLQELVNSGVLPPKSPGRQVVIGGPIGSGRTALAAGIGTELAFNGAKVRYLSFDNLLEFAVGPSHDDLGPRNIGYWPWDEAQIVIIDNIGPVIGAQRAGHTQTRTQFEKHLDDELDKVAPAFEKCI